MAKMGTVEYFENFIENSMKESGENTHEALYRFTFALFDLIAEGSFTPSKKEQLEQLLNLREAMNRISKRLGSTWETVL